MSDILRWFRSGSSNDERMPIEPNRQLISKRLAHLSGVREYYDQSLDARLVVMPADKEQYTLHRNLRKAGVPVFDAMHGADGSTQLLIPEGSRTVRQSLNLIARDVESYGETFHQIGKALRALQKGGFGGIVPDLERGVLASLAISLDDSEDYGGGIYLVPPYTLSDAMNMPAEKVAIRNELLESGHFDNSSLEVLLDRVQRGFDG